MRHLLPFVLCLAGFAGLALATERQQRTCFGGPLRAVTTYVLRAAGVSVLLFALGILITWQSAGLGLVTFSGLTSLTAGIVYCALLGVARTRAP